MHSVSECLCPAPLTAAAQDYTTQQKPPANSPLESFGPPEIQPHEIELHNVLGQGAPLLLCCHTVHRTPSVYLVSEHAFDPTRAPSIRTSKHPIVHLTLLHAGAFGTVWLGSCRAIDVAVKVPVNSRRITAKQLEAFQAEVKIMRSAT